MNNGFFEFGFLALVAFAFGNLIWVVTMLREAPPVRRRSELTHDILRELEAGIPLEGAELVTPTLKKETRVG